MSKRKFSVTTPMSYFHFGLEAPSEIYPGNSGLLLLVVHHLHLHLPLLFLHHLFLPHALLLNPTTVYCLYLALPLHSRHPPAIFTAFVWCKLCLLLSTLLPWILKEGKWRTSGYAERLKKFVHEDTYNQNGKNRVYIICTYIIYICNFYI